MLRNLENSYNRTSWKKFAQALNVTGIILLVFSAMFAVTDYFYTNGYIKNTIILGAIGLITACIGCMVKEWDEGEECLDDNDRG